MWKEQYESKTQIISNLQELKTNTLDSLSIPKSSVSHLLTKWILSPIMNICFTKIEFNMFLRI